MIETITTLLSRCEASDRNFPPTDLYNEGWMLRLILDWFSKHTGIDHPLSFSATDKWYSEALLPTAFLARHRGDNLAESWTHADGAVGDIAIGVNRDGDLTLTESASRFMILEAKMFSKLSSGVKNARYYNQAARNVACIAEVICRADIPPDTFKKIGFYVIAPDSQIINGVFSEFIEKNNIRKIVQRRVSEYEDSGKEDWFNGWFLPLLDRIEILQLSWEGLLRDIIIIDPEYGETVEIFYQKCTSFNRPKLRKHLKTND